MQMQTSLRSLRRRRCPLQQTQQLKAIHNPTRKLQHKRPQIVQAGCSLSHKTCNLMFKTSNIPKSSSCSNLLHKAHPKAPQLPSCSSKVTPLNSQHCPLTRVLLAATSLTSRSSLHCSANANEIRRLLLLETIQQKTMIVSLIKIINP